MHQILLPVAFVASAVSPKILAEAIDHVFFPLAFVFVALAPDIAANPVFFAIFVVSYKLGAVRPNCLTLAVLDIVDPHTGVDCPILALVSSHSI